MIVAPFAVVAAMMSFSIAAYACTYYVGLLNIWGDITGTTSGSQVVVTGNDKWGTDALGPMTQSVNATIAKAHKYNSGSGSACTSGGWGCFYVSTGSGGKLASFNETTSDIWYDVNTIPIGYTSHTTWGGDPTYDCMTWNLNAFGVKNAGSVKIGAKGGANWSVITQATNGAQGSGSAVTVTSGVAGPFYIQSNETAANVSPKESGICLSDHTSTNGDQAPLTLV